jgi:hypothetical protein
MDARPAGIPDRLRPGTVARAAYVAFLAITVLLSVRFIQRALPNYLPKDWSLAHDADGLEDWLCVRFYQEGKSPYTPAALAELKRSTIGHPPTTAFWFIWMGGFEKAIAAEIISLSTLLFLLLHLYLCARALKFPAPVAVAVLGFSWLFTTDGLIMHWHAIQLSEQIAFALVVCWLYLRRGKQLPAGLALGIAMTFKLFPGILMLLLLLARRFRAFLVAAGVYGFVAVFMTATYGLASWTMFLEQQKITSRAWMGSVRSASLQGIVLRLLSPICKGNVLPRTAATVIAAIVGVALLIGAGLLCRKTLQHAREHDPTSIDLPFALITMVAIFLNPWIWEHYHVFLIQPAFVVGARVFTAFRSTLRGWLDERVAHATLARAGAVLLVSGAALLAVGWLFSINVYAKTKLEGQWYAQPTPWLHRHLHLMEAFNWLPWVIMIALTMLVVSQLSPRAAPAQS